MKHLASTTFWESYRNLPEHIRALADKNYSLLKENPNVDEGLLWFWIGSHADYDAQIGQSNYLLQGGRGGLRVNF